MSMLMKTTTEERLANIDGLREIQDELSEVSRNWKGSSTEDPEDRLHVQFLLFNWSLLAHQLMEALLRAEVDRALALLPMASSDGPINPQDTTVQ